MRNNILIGKCQQPVQSQHLVLKVKVTILFRNFLLQQILLMNCSAEFQEQKYVCMLTLKLMVRIVYKFSNICCIYRKVCFRPSRFLSLVYNLSKHLLVELTRTRYCNRDFSNLNCVNVQFKPHTFAFKCIFAKFSYLFRRFQVAIEK